MATRQSTLERCGSERTSSRLACAPPGRVGAAELVVWPDQGVRLAGVGHARAAGVAAAGVLPRVAPRAEVPLVAPLGQARLGVARARRALGRGPPDVALPREVAEVPGGRGRRARGTGTPRSRGPRASRGRRPRRRRPSGPAGTARGASGAASRRARAACRACPRPSPAARPGPAASARGTTGPVWPGRPARLVRLALPSHSTCVRLACLPGAIPGPPVPSWRRDGLPTADMSHPPMSLARPGAGPAACVPGSRAPRAREATPTHLSA